jgi:hypothetical protein
VRPANNALHLTGPALQFFETSRSLRSAGQVNVSFSILRVWWDWRDGPRRLGLRCPQRQQVRISDEIFSPLKESGP